VKRLRQLVSAERRTSKTESARTFSGAGMEVDFVGFQPEMGADSVRHVVDRQFADAAERANCRTYDVVEFVEVGDREACLGQCRGRLPKNATRDAALVGMALAIGQFRKRSRFYGISQARLHLVETALVLAGIAVVTNMGADDFSVGLRLVQALPSRWSTPKPRLSPSRTSAYHHSLSRILMLFKYRRPRQNIKGFAPWEANQ
jgi:hypothetical protein